MVSAPALRRRWWAGSGLGAFVAFDDQPAHAISASGVSHLESSSLSFSSISGWAECGLREKFFDLTDHAWRVRAYGDFFSYCLVAEGAVDIACEPEVSLWDLAPLDILVREAGGRFTALDGTPVPQAAMPWPPTATCTTRCWQRWPRRALTSRGHWLPAAEPCS